MAAVRVPPSAWSTSQSRTIVFSPNALVSTTARSARPTSREISCVRPPSRPLTDSRSERVFVERGNIAYSAVTQPSPLPCRQRGTPVVTLAAHNTRVRPNSTSTEPSAWSSQPRVSTTGRRASGARPAGRGMHPTVLDLVRRADARFLDRAGEPGGGAFHRLCRIVPRHLMGDDEPAHLSALCVVGGFAAGEVHAGRIVDAVGVRRLAEKQ